MFVVPRVALLSRSALLKPPRLAWHIRAPRRFLHDQPTYESKYAEKLQQAAQKQGTTVAELKAQLKAQELEARKERLRAASEALSTSPAHATPSAPTSPGATAPSPGRSPVRKDNSPVKHLSTYLNLDRLVQTPHTSDQIAALWTTYHASRSNGTGRGFLCAAVPLDAYEKMADAARRYESFVLPLVRESPAEAPGASEKAYEFFFLQWAFHGAPRAPTPVPTPALPWDAPLAQAGPPPPPSSGLDPNPPTATVLLTPLQEYKLRQSFATPYLTLTFHTDLARSHGVVLLRGEITPTAASAPASAAGAATDADAGAVRYFLTQQDAQLLTLAMQRFYLWSGLGAEEREALLRAFHDKPEEFKWEELLRHAEVL